MHKGLPGCCIVCISCSKDAFKGRNRDYRDLAFGDRPFFALRDYRMFREDGEELVRATSEWMYIDMKRRRPLRLPENVIAMSTEHNIPKLVLAPLLDEKEFGGERQGIRHFTATFDNIDFNGHVTQASYVRWITNSLPFGF